MRGGTAATPPPRYRPPAALTRVAPLLPCTARPSLPAVGEAKPSVAFAACSGAGREMDFKLFRMNASVRDRMKVRLSAKFAPTRVRSNAQSPRALLSLIGRHQPTFRVALFFLES